MTREAIRLLTVGHGARPIDALVAVLVEAEAAVLVDVRRFPGSRRHPQFGREPLASAVAQAGIGYEWWGEALGGRRPHRPDSRHPALRQAAFAGYADHTDSVEFRSAVTELLARARVERTVVMCAETLWWRCHRRLIADAVAMRGAAVTHLLEVGRRQPHPLSASMRRGADGWPVYDVSDALSGL